MDWQDVVIRNINAAPRHTDPYRYLYITPIFPPEFYRTLLEFLPPEVSYKDKKSYPGRQTQVCFDIGQSTIWHEVNDFLHSDWFRDTLLSKFSLAHQGRSLYYLHRDLDGFHIKPHTDVRSKLLSYIFYLPIDNMHAHLGTWMLKPKTPNYIWSKHHRPWEEFTRVAMAPYWPNSLFVWAVDRTSYHAVDIHFDATDTMQARQTVRGFIFRDDMPLPYTFQEDAEYHGLELSAV